MYRYTINALSVRLFHDQKDVAVKALVDSGADQTLFPATIAEVLEIDLRSGTPRAFYGIEGEGVLGFVHPIRLQIKGFNESIEIEAAFTEDDRIPILGQIGLFDFYQITFERYRGRFEIWSRTHLYR